MKIVKSVGHETMVKMLQKEAAKKFDACNPDHCPRCRISDG